MSIVKINLRVIYHIVKKPGVLLPIIVVVVAGGIVAWMMRPGDNVEMTAEEAITGFTAENLDSSFAGLDLYIVNPERHEEAAAEAAKYISSSDPEVAFAAIYLLGLTGSASDAAALRPALENDNASLRTLAAGTLIGWGEKEAIPVLIDSLTSEELLPYSEPPTPLLVLAAEALPYYTGEDFGVSQKDWLAWFDTTGDKLSWNEESQTYE